MLYNIHDNEIPLYFLVWKLCHDLERERKVLKAFFRPCTSYRYMVSTERWVRNTWIHFTENWIRFEDIVFDHIFPPNTIYLESKTIWPNFLPQDTCLKNLFSFLANITQIHPRISRTNSYTHKLLPLSSVWHAKLLFRDFIFSSGFMLSLFIKKSSLFQKQTSREDIISWQYLHIFQCDSQYI